MDTMLINSKFMRGLINFVLKRELKKKLGCNIDVRVIELAGTLNDNDKVELDINLTASMKTDDLKKILDEKVFTKES